MLKFYNCAKLLSVKKLAIFKNTAFLTTAGLAALAILISLLYYFFSNRIAFLNILSAKTADVFTRAVYQIKPKPKELRNICVITIDDESFTALQKKWPWPRSLLASFITELQQYQPKIISADLTFIGESQESQEDLALQQAIKASGNVILSAYIAPDGTLNKPFAAFRKSALDFGFINKPREKDNIVRASRILFPRQKNSEIFDLCFGLKSALYFLGLDKEKLQLQSGALIINRPRTDKGSSSLYIPLSNQGTALINYQAKKTDFQIIPFHKVLRHMVSANEIAGKIALVGVSAEIFHDVYSTPLGIMPGVLLNGNEILTYLSANFIHEAPWIFQLLLLVTIAALSAILTYKLKVLEGFIALICQLLALIALSFILRYQNITFDYFGPIFLATFVYAGTESFKYVRLIVEAAMLKTMAITDGLTGLYVLRYLVLKLDSEFHRAQEENTNLSFLIMDIDHFKKINDTYGHEEGNVILKHIAQILKDSSRKVDIVARYGGEEFCAILPGTPEKGAQIYAQRVREAIENFAFPYQESQTLKATISIGIASLKNANPQNPQDLIASADKALYEAKETGRNKVCVFTPPKEPTEK